MFQITKTMKKALFVSALAAAVLAACQSPEAVTSPDVRTFGMKGDVKTVSYTIEDIELSEEPGYEPEYDLELSFDEQGRVTQDSYNNVYEYDAEGNFVRGSGKRTVMQRDAQGRVILYDNTILPEDGNYEESDFDHFIKIEIAYDAQGRMDLLDFEGPESISQTKYIYKDDQPYPSIEYYNTQYETFTEDGTLEYEYTAFDKKGNWTERTILSTTKEWDLEDEDSEVETSETRYRERRIITYWSDKN